MEERINSEDVLASMMVSLERMAIAAEHNLKVEREILALLKDLKKLHLQWFAKNTKQED